MFTDSPRSIIASWTVAAMTAVLHAPLAHAGDDRFWREQVSAPELHYPAASRHYRSISRSGADLLWREQVAEPSQWTFTTSYPEVVVNQDLPWREQVEAPRPAPRLEVVVGHRG